MFSQILHHLTQSLAFRSLSRDEAYLSSAVDLGQLECRVLALDHGLEI